MEGKYRFLSKYILRRFNEKNPIITKYKIISFKTYNLPFLPSLLKRVITHIVIEYKGKANTTSKQFILGTISLDSNLFFPKSLQSINSMPSSDLTFSSVLLQLDDMEYVSNQH